VSIGSSGRILLSSEGVHSPVLEVTLPTQVEQALRGPGASPSPSPAGVERPSTSSVAGDGHGWLLVVAAAAALVGGALILLLVPRRGSRRSRDQ
jgi:hypothetical protein